MSFKDRLKEARVACGLKQVELSRKLGLSQNVVSNYENGSSNPNVDVLYKLMDILNVEPNFLFQDEVSIKDSVSLSANEKNIVKSYRKLNDIGRKKVKGYICDLSTHPQYTSDCADVYDEEDYRSAPFIAAQGGGINQSGKNLTIDEIKELNRLADDGDDGIIE